MKSSKYYISIRKDNKKTVYKFARKKEKGNMLVFVEDNKKELEINGDDLKNSLLCDKNYDLSLDRNNLK
jgi:hypothetical protein